MQRRRGEGNRWRSGSISWGASAPSQLLIFGELARGLLRDESRDRLIEILGRYEVDGVILGCTELPLLLKQEDWPVILLDTLDLHASAALDYALAGEKIQQGGPGTA